MHVLFSHLLQNFTFSKDVLLHSRPVCDKTLFTPVYLILQTAFVSNNQDTITLPLKKSPRGSDCGCYVWQQGAGTIQGQRLPLEAPTPVLDLYLFLSGSDPSPQKIAFHTHSALKLLLEGKEALKGLNPRADGTWARTGQDGAGQTGWPG